MGGMVEEDEFADDAFDAVSWVACTIDSAQDTADLVVAREDRHAG